MITYILDSFAILSYCEGEKGAQSVADLFKRASRGKVRLLLSVVNWGEVYYIALREGGRERANEYERIIGSYPIEVVSADHVLTREAAEFKAMHSISYADAFAAALASITKGKLVTGDPEFKPLREKIKIEWIVR